MSLEELFTPLEFRNLTLRNRILRSNISGRFDDYDGTGTQARINWELKFARGGVGAIVSSWCGVHRRGFIVPGYASIETDERIPFWRELGRRVHEHGCPYILQLAFGGRQRDINGVEFERGWSSTDKPDPLHGFQCERMTKAQIEEVTEAFAEGARRAKEAGLDGVEIHGANGYVFTQFLSSAINDRDDEYGGSLENRARFLLDTVRAIRERVGDDFHLQVKLSTTEYGNALMPWAKKGNTIEDSVQVARWVEQAGADAIHVSSGNTFPHPGQPRRCFLGQGRGRHLRRDALERDPHLPQLPALPHLAVLAHSGASRAAQPEADRRARTSATRPRSSGRCRSPSSAPVGSSGARRSPRRSGEATATRSRSRAR